MVLITRWGKSSVERIKSWSGERVNLDVVGRKTQVHIYTLQLIVLDYVT